MLLASVWAYPCNWSAWKVGLCICTAHHCCCCCHWLSCRIGYMQTCSAMEKCAHIH